MTELEQIAAAMVIAAVVVAGVVTVLSVHAGQQRKQARTPRADCRHIQYLRRWRF